MNATQLSGRSGLVWIRRHVAVLLLVGIGLVALAGVAAAYWTVTVNSGAQGSAAGATLTPPASVRATVGANGAVTIAWAHPSGELVGATYAVTRTGGNEGSTVICSGTGGSSCTDTGPLTPGASYNYAAVAVLGTNWQSTPTTATATAATPTFAIALSSSPYTAGSPITITSVTATLPGGSTDITYGASSGTIKTVTWSGLPNSPAPANQVPSYPSSSVTFTNGVANPSSTFTAYDAGSNTLVATDASNPSATGGASFTVGAAAVHTLVISSIAASGSAGSTASLGPITVSETDSFGNPTTTAETVTLSSNSTGTAVFSATLNGTPTPTVSIPGGTSSTTFYYGDTRAGSPTITAAKTGLSSAIQVETITAAAANKFVLTSPVSGAAASTASLGPITVSETDSFGNPTTTAETVTLSSNSTGTAVFSATLNGTPTPTVSIPGGTSSTTFYYGDTKAGSPTITASGSLTNGTQTATIAAAAANKLAFTSTVSGNQAVSSTASVGPFAVQVQDSFGNPVTNTGSAVTVTVSTTSAGTTGHTPFFTPTSGASTASAVTIATSASSTPSFYYSDTKAGTPTISASTTVNTQAVNGSTNGFTMIAAAANKLAFTSTVSGNQAVGSTASVGPFAVQVQDSFGNPVTNTGSAVTVTVSTTSAGTTGHTPFFTPTSGASTASAVTIATSASSTPSFYYSDTKAGTPTISASTTVNTQAVNGSTNGFTMVAGPEAGIALSNITTTTTPPVSCSGSVGSVNCSSTGEASNSGNVLTAKLQLVDQFGNVVTDTGSTIGIDLAASGNGNVSPIGPNALSILNGASSTSASFTLTRSNGSGKTVTMTATVHGTSQTLTVALSS